MKKSNSREYFETVAGKWDNMQQSYFSDKTRGKAYATAKIKEGDRIADIGAGTGYMTIGLIDKNVEIIAVDQSKTMLDTMRKKIGNNKRVKYCVGESENIPITDNYIDCIFANMYLHHVKNPFKSIKEMSRTLKPGGKLILTDLDEHEYEFLRIEQYDKWLGFKREDIKLWFKRNGLKNVVIDCVDDNCRSDSKNNNEKAEISIFIAYGEKPHY